MIYLAQEESGQMADDKDPEALHWAGHGNISGFLLQTLTLIVINLGIWGFIFLLALRLSGKPMPWA